MIVMWRDVSLQFKVLVSLSLLFCLSTCRGLPVDHNSCVLHNSTASNAANGSDFRQYKVIVSTTSEYLPIFFNWLIFYQAVCQNFEPLHIICLDKKIEENLPKYGLKCSFVYYIQKDRWAFNRLWQIRAQETKRLVDEGYDVLLSDSDALWLRSPFPDLNQYPSSHIIATRARFPEWIHGRIGSAICMGFIYIKASQLISSFWHEFIESLVRLRNPDDQRLLNELVFRKGLKFSRRLKFYNSDEGDSGYFRHDQQHIHITLLPQQSFRRVCDIVDANMTSNSTVLHCVTKEKKEVSKMSVGKKHGQWRLDPMWSKVPLTPSTTIQRFLHQVTMNDTNEVI